MKKFTVLAALFLATGGTGALAQSVDCSVIKNNPPSYKRCMDGVREAAFYGKEKRRHEIRAKVRDAVCVADAAGGSAAAMAAGWPGRIVYRGTRAAADAISNGASRCPR